MKRIIFGLIFVLIALIGVSSVSASEIINCSLETNFCENNIALDEIGNVNVDNSAIDNSQATPDIKNVNQYVKLSSLLQTEVYKAPENSTLNLNFNIANIDHSIKINKNLTIDGNGHSMDCSKKSKCSIFESNCGHITLKNLKLIDCKDSAITLSGTAQLTVDNCTFMNNHGNMGGAIKNTAGTVLNIKNSHFESNIADKNGGAIYTTGKINMENTKVISNSADIGGGIFTKSDANLFKCELSKNSAPLQYGGALASEGNVTLNCTTVSDNTARWGGSVCCENNVNIINSTFTGNRASVGGAIWARYNVILQDSENTRSTFAYNTAGYAGGIYCAENIWLANVDFYGNRAEDGGNAVVAYDETIHFGDGVRSLNETENGLEEILITWDDFTCEYGNWDYDMIKDNWREKFEP